MGYFITFEGVEGVGKSTQCQMLADSLTRDGAQVVRTREPGGTELGEKLRAVLLEPTQPALCEMSELLIMFAARAEHITRVIRPALADGSYVVCDRFTDATFAYQGGGRGVDRRLISRLEHLVQGDLRPDLTLLLDMDVTEGLARAAKRSASDRFEQETVEFFERVRRSYLAQAAREPERVIVIDASQDIDSVAGQVLESVRTRLG